MEDILEFRRQLLASARHTAEELSLRNTSISACFDSYWARFGSFRLAEADYVTPSWSLFIDFPYILDGRFSFSHEVSVSLRGDGTIVRYVNGNSVPLRADPICDVGYGYSRFHYLLPSGEVSRERFLQHDEWILSLVGKIGAFLRPI
jgi:hypothetical protein